MVSLFQRSHAQKESVPQRSIVRKQSGFLSRLLRSPPPPALSISAPLPTNEIPHAWTLIAETCSQSTQSLSLHTSSPFTPLFPHLTRIETRSSGTSSSPNSPISPTDFNGSYKLVKTSTDSSLARSIAPSSLSTRTRRKAVPAFIELGSPYSPSPPPGSTDNPVVDVERAPTFPVFEPTRDPTYAPRFPKVSPEDSADFAAYQSAGREEDLSTVEGSIRRDGEGIIGRPGGGGESIRSFRSSIYSLSSASEYSVPPDDRLSVGGVAGYSLAAACVGRLAVGRTISLTGSLPVVSSPSSPLRSSFVLRPESAMISSDEFPLPPTTIPTPFGLQTPKLPANDAPTLPSLPSFELPALDDFTPPLPLRNPIIPPTLPPPTFLIAPPKSPSLIPRLAHRSIPSPPPSKSITKVSPIAVRIQSRGRSVYISPKKDSGRSEKQKNAIRSLSEDEDDVLDIHLQV